MSVRFHLDFGQVPPELAQQRQKLARIEPDQQEEPSGRDIDLLSTRRFKIRIAFVIPIIWFQNADKPVPLKTDPIPSKLKNPEVSSRRRLDVASRQELSRRRIVKVESVIEAFHHSCKKSRSRFLRIEDLPEYLKLTESSRVSSRRASSCFPLGTSSALYQYVQM